ncbi:MAG: TolC family protein [Deltaproteobacteria bacterium]|nr:TolC family protein [Deltaproteobacteria bacterium]
MNFTLTGIRQRLGAVVFKAAFTALNFIALACIALVLVALPRLTQAGSLMPDRGYNLESLYSTPAVLPATAARVPDRYPEPEWHKAPSLPAIESGRLVLSLEQAVLLALRRNRELQVQRYGPVIAGTFEEIERGLFDPQLLGDVNYSKERASEVSRSTEERFSVEGEDLNLNSGLQQHLPSGADLGLNLSYERSTSNRTPEQQQFRVGLSLTQALLQGFGPKVNLAAVRQAQLAGQASVYELRGFVEALVAEVEIAYWCYVLAGEGLALYQRSLEVAGQQLYEVEKRIEVGVLPRNAAAAARAEKARRQQALLAAQSQREERRLRLLRLLNAEAEAEFALQITATSSARTEVADLGDDFQARLELADKLRPDLNEARLRREQHRLEVVRTRNGLLPKLDLFFDLGKTGYGEALGKAFKNIDRDNYEVTAGISFSAYLNNRQAAARDLAARASLEQTGLALENLRSLVQMDVRLARNEVENARQQITAGAVTRAFQEQTLQAETERFAIGASTSLLVAQAQRDLLSSQLSEVEALIAYRIALVNLYLAEGSLLEHRGISLASVR